MLLSTRFLALLALVPALALGAPGHRHQHQHRHPAGLAKRALATKVAWTTVQVTRTVTLDPNADATPPTDVEKVQVQEIKVDTKPSSPAEVASSAPPTVQVANVDYAPVEPTSPAETPSATSSSAQASATVSKSSKPATGAAGKVVFKNNCSYDVKFDLVRTLALCGTDETDVPVRAGDSWTSDLCPCEGANPALKVYKTTDTSKAKPFQFEFGYTPSQSMAWYNLSPKDCVSDMYGAGLDDCPGNAWYIDATSSHSLAKDTRQCRTYQCNDATSCCTENAYCDAYASAARALGGLEPVSGCPGSVEEIAIVMQIC